MCFVCSNYAKTEKKFIVSEEEENLSQINTDILLILAINNKSTKSKVPQQRGLTSSSLSY